MPKKKQEEVVLDVSEDDWIRDRRVENSRHACQTCGELSYQTHADGRRTQVRVAKGVKLAICSSCLIGNGREEDRPKKEFKREAVKRKSELRKSAVKKKGR